MSDETPDLRASDADRRRIAETLERAFSEGRLDVGEFDERITAAWSSRHTSELARLTHDLPEADPSSAGTGASAPSPDRVTGDGAGPSASIAVMSGVDRHGEWTVPESHHAFALMGGVDLDLRQARLAAPVTRIEAYAVMGGIDIVVPADVRVEVEGIGLMGSFSEEREADPPAPPAPEGAPVVRVTGLALMGGVSVRRTTRHPHED